MSTLDLESAKNFLRITSNDDDDELQDTINAAESIIEALVGPLLNTAKTAIVPELQTMIGFKGPIVSVQSITGAPIYGSPTVSLTNITVDTDGFAYLPASLLVSYCQGPYTVAYTAGFAATAGSLPAALLQAIKELTRHMWTSQRGSGATRPGASPPEFLPGAAYALPIRVEQLLAPYRTPGVA